MTDLTAAIEAAARAMSAWFWLHPDHDEKPLLDDAARAAVEAAAPLIRAQVAEEIAAALIERESAQRNPIRTTAFYEAIRIAREHATTPAEETT